MGLRDFFHAGKYERQRSIQKSCSQLHPNDLTDEDPIGNLILAITIGKFVNLSTLVIMQLYFM